ncbi:hypothetical protein [Microbulbifer agarilyticus]
MKKYIFALLMIASFESNAALEYCQGTIVDFVTRNSASEATQFRLQTSEGISGWAQIGGPEGYNEYQEVQISMILAAYMANKPITVELSTTGYSFTSCTEFEDRTPVRNIRLRS